MYRRRLYLTIVICLCLLIVGCFRQSPPVPPKTPDPTPPTEGGTPTPAPDPEPEPQPPEPGPVLARNFPHLTPVLGRELLYLGIDGGEGVLLDFGDNDRTYSLAGAGAAWLTRLVPFSVVILGANQSDGELFVSMHSTPASRGLPVVSASGAEEAAQLYPPALMERFVFSTWNQYAIEDFTIKSISVVSIEGNRVTVEFVADLKPVVDPFARIRSRWDVPGEDGYLRDRRLVLDLYTRGGFYCSFMPEWWADIFAEGAPRVDRTPRDTLYRPARYPDMWQALNDGHAVEQVLLEDDASSYISEVRLRSGPGLGHFETRLYRIERDSGARLPLSPVLQDTYSVLPLAVHGSAFFLQTEMAYPASEGSSGHVAVIDLKTAKYTVLLSEPTALLGKAAGTIYIARLGGDASTTPASGIYALSAASGELRRVSDLLGPSFSTAYESSHIRYFSGGRLYITWPRGAPGDEYALFVLDPVTGTFEEIK